MCPSSRHPGAVAAVAAAGESVYRPAFEVIDTDCDGKISRDDLRAFYSAAAVPVSDDDIATMISAADSDEDGFVEYDEFEKVLGRRRESTDASPGGILAEAFGVMDRDGDGRVGFDDLKAYLEWAGMKVEDEEVAAMIRMGGGDDSRGIGLDDLRKILSVDSFVF